MTNLIEKITESKPAKVLALVVGLGAIGGCDYKDPNTIGLTQSGNIVGVDYNPGSLRDLGTSTMVVGPVKEYDLRTGETLYETPDGKEDTLTWLYRDQDIEGSYALEGSNCRVDGTRDTTDINSHVMYHPDARVTSSVMGDFCK